MMILQLRSGKNISATNTCIRFSSITADESLVSLLPFDHKNAALHHPAGTSKDSDSCDLSNISDIKICIVGNGNIHIFKHPAYLSKDLGEIYI